MDAPELGVGLVYMPGLEPLLEPGACCVDVIEIEPETLWRFRPGADRPYVLPRETLAQIKAFPQRKIVHSVGHALGGTCRPSDVFADALAETIDVLEAPWASEHLSITQFRQGTETLETSFMLPSLQTEAGARTAASTIADLAGRLPVPLAVETAVNYLAPRAHEMPDGAFVADVVRRADCGILLDLHNIWTNERNGRQPVSQFLADLPLDRVWEIHLGGGFEFGGYWLDAHSGAVPPPVLDLAAELIPVLPNLKAVIFEIFPTYIPLFGLDRIRDEMETIHGLWARRGADTVAAAKPAPAPTPTATDPCPAPGSPPVTPRLWEETLGRLVVHGTADGPLARSLGQDPAIALIRKMVWKFRAGAILRSLTMLTQLIRLYAGDDALEALLDGYFKTFPPQGFASEEARRFLAHVGQHAPDIPYLDDIMAYEDCALRTLLEETPHTVPLAHDPRVLLAALSAGELPVDLVPGSYELELTPDADAPPP